MAKHWNDAGHGGSDPGAVALGMQEDDWSLAFTTRATAGLRRCGIEVGETRTSDVTVALGVRDDLADNWKADYFTSWHLNSNSGNPASGFESFIQSGNYAGKAETDRKRRLIHNEIAAVIKPYGLVDRGCKEADLSVLRETDCPAALYEMAFINNPKDQELLRNPKFLTDIVEASVKGGCKVHGKTYIPPQTESPVYYFIVGGFHEESKNKYQAELNQKGYWHVVVDKYPL